MKTFKRIKHIITSADAECKRGEEKKDIVASAAFESKLAMKRTIESNVTVTTGWRRPRSAAVIRPTGGGTRVNKRSQ